MFGLWGLGFIGFGSSGFSISGFRFRGSGFGAWASFDFLGWGLGFRAVRWNEDVERDSNNFDWRAKFS